MTVKELIVTIENYEGLFRSMLPRFVETYDGLVMSNCDEPVFRRKILEIRDLLADTGFSEYSDQIVAYFNEGIVIFQDAPSYASVERIIGAIAALLTRLNRMAKDGDGLPSQKFVVRAAENSAESTQSHVFGGRGDSRTRRAAKMPNPELDPWRVIRSFLSKANSYTVPDIVDSSGLSVDWRISDRENYSHTTRWSAYRPRIDAAYEALANDDDRLRVVFVIARELSRRGLAEGMDAALREIGWALEDGRLIPAKGEIRELFFPEQSQHDAYVEIRGILKQAKESVLIVDPYVDGSTLTLLTTCASAQMKLQILTAKLPKDFGLEKRGWESQHKTTIEVRTTREFHDRFIVIDGNQCWHIGCSIKDAGNKAFMLSRVEDETNRTNLVDSIMRAWNAGTNG